MIPVAYFKKAVGVAWTIRRLKIPQYAGFRTAIGRGWLYQAMRRSTMQNSFRSLLERAAQQTPKAA